MGRPEFKFFFSVSAMIRNIHGTSLGIEPPIEHRAGSKPNYTIGFWIRTIFRFAVGAFLCFRRQAPCLIKAAISEDPVRVR